MAQELPPTEAREDERGAALVIVLWVIVVLTAQVGIFSLQVRDGAMLVENAAAVARGETLLHAAVETAAARLTARIPEERWTADGTDRHLPLGGGGVLVSVHDDNGLININLADRVLLEGLIHELTGSRRSASMLADRIVDWRDPDHDRRRAGAEDQDYKRAGAGYGAADQPFLDPSDLVRVLDMPAELAERMQSHVTVYTADARINPRLASEVVLRSLPGVTADLARQAAEMARRGGQAASAIDSLLATAAPYLSSARGPAYRIRMQVLGSRREAIGRGEAVILLGADAAKPYHLLSWRFRSG